jgi:ABC-type dipeptide/oligopeptide/nickel transport system permease subunit
VPLLLGALIVLALFVGVLFGPALAPKNPYLSGRQVTEYVDGEIVSPPFPPSPKYPLGSDALGRDTLSMLLYGTRNTLVAAAFITMARLLVGLVLGGLAGWNEGQWVDRLVMGAIQLLISVPMLLLAAILILALDIRRGLPIFILALCAVGWGEIAQYVRAEFIQIKEQLYIESARAIGLNGFGLAVRHVLPNVLPALVVITLLEMGAVLMILGELGFVGIFIGGGTAIQVGDVTQRQVFAVPEWGAMMAGSRHWARAKPWMVLAPAVAFFVSVTGFNLLGEGLRRLIERGVFNTAVLLSWRVIVGAAVISGASIYVILTLGPAPSYRQLAQQVDREAIMEHVAFFGDEEMSGRGLGSPGADLAARYVEAAFELYSLSAPPGGRLQEVSFTLAEPEAAPELALVDDEGRTEVEFVRWADYSETIERHGGSGTAEAPVTLVTFASGTWGDGAPGERYARFRGLDLRGRIALVLGAQAPDDFDTEALIRGAEGVLIVSDDIRPRHQVLPGDYLEQPSLPILRITSEAADTILSADGLTISSIREGKVGPAAEGAGWRAEDLDARIRIKVSLGEPRAIRGFNVLGLIRGSDAALDDELVVVSAHYDGLGRAPDGTIYPGANDNGSGVGVMLEVIRLWHEQGFQPRRTVLFAAWSGGQLPYSGAHVFRDESTVFNQHEIASVIHLDRLGGGRGDGLVVRKTGGRDTLYNLLADCAGDVGVPVREGLSFYHPYQQFISGDRGDRHVARDGSLVVTWGGPDPALADDTLDQIDSEHLSKSAEAVNLMLIQAAHEPRY